VPRSRDHLALLDFRIHCKPGKAEICTPLSNPWYKNCVRSKSNKSRGYDLQHLATEAVELRFVFDRSFLPMFIFEHCVD
jgi:hypothetical protein